VVKAIGMSGTDLYGIPIIIQATEAEKNKAAEDAAAALEKVLTPIPKLTLSQSRRPRSQSRANSLLRASHSPSRSKT
jgi:hypothetical protein